MTEIKRRTFLAPLLVLSFSVGLTILVSYFVRKDNNKIAEQQLEIVATEIKAKIQSRLNAYIQFSQSSSAFFMASDTITREDWKFFIEKSNVSNYLKGFQGVAYITNVPKKHLQNHSNRFKKEFSNDYKVFPEVEIDKITPIIFIEPLIDRNIKAVGFNISSDTNMRKALDESRDSNTAILTNKVILIQEGINSKQPGIVIYSPVYFKNMPTHNVNDRRKAISSWAAISFRINDFMEGIIDLYNLEKENKIHLNVFDGKNLNTKSLLYNSDVKFNNKIIESYNNFNLPIEFNGKIWILQFSQPKINFLNGFSFTVLILGLIFSILLSFLVFSLSNTANFAKRIANKLTADLSKNNEELILAKETAEESERQLKLISNNLVNGMIYQVISIDENKRKFTYVSETVNEMYGCTVEQAKENAEFIYGRIHKDDIQKLILKEQVSINQLSIFKTEARVVNPDGSIRWSYFVSKPRSFKGVVCWDGIEIDITEQKKIENELIIAKGNAEESNRLKTEFLNNMSHEIRTPMNGILGFSDFLLTPNLSDEKKKNYIQIIQSSGKQLLHVIDDIIEISRLGTKQVRVIESEACLNDLFLELFSIFDIKAKENKIPLYVKNSLSDKESTILTDKSKINKILSNLLENSLKFTNEGYIEFGYKLIENQLEIYVKDTGVGIETEKHDFIFDRFSQFEKDLSKRMGGLGLGLSIVKENVELIGGKIRVESKKGTGATFFITIPYKNVYTLSEDDKKMSALNEKYTILIAEDEEVNYLFLETLINEILKIDCNILHAKNGKEAVEFCLIDDSIRLVLMDLKMPVMSGFEALNKIKKFKPQLILVAQSAYSTAEEIEKALSIGFDDFISKPISVQNFQNLINKHLYNFTEENLQD
jgi:PAS domain S-box-containing protein